MSAIFPTAYFGSISYYQKLTQFESVEIEQWETYPKHSSRNHCCILTPNGSLDLIVPLRKDSGSKTITKDVRVDYSTDWVKKHWRTFVSGYASSPYFDHYGMEVEELLNKKFNFLLDLNFEINTLINSWLDLGLDLHVNEEFLKVQENDFRLSFNRRVGQADYSYQQVFTDSANFEADLSILDAIFNLGPMARKLLIN